LLGILAAKLDTACGPYQLKKLLFVSDALPIEMDGYGRDPVGFLRAGNTLLLVAYGVVDRLADAKISGCQGFVGWFYPLFSHRFTLRLERQKKKIIPDFSNFNSPQGYRKNHQFPPS
jgi:hypothetical protein